MKDSTSIDTRKIDEFIKKAMDAKKDIKMDLSQDEDLSIAVMNLVSLEEHFFFSGAKTKNPMYYELLNQIRSMRKDLLKRIIKEYEGEVWCISKHLLAASMRVMEYGTKLLSQEKDEEARAMFSKSYDLYSLFWGLNLNLINVEGVKKISGTSLNKHDEQKNTGVKDTTQNSSGGLFAKLGNLVKKVVDCCLE